ncbi:MAG: fumarylacetoacetate hydrolase family protein [Alphaproteobacteria bacterium]
MQHLLTAEAALPEDGYAGTLIARVWRPGIGPAIARVTEAGVFDITRNFPTIADVLAAEDPAAAIQAVTLGQRIGSLDDVLAEGSDRNCPHILAPQDIQPVKAAGVTFAASMLERVIEEQAKGDPARAEAVRAAVKEKVGDDLSKVEPGSDGAEALKEHLIELGVWSQYLEVGIGPYAEIFTKCPPMAAVGTGAAVGLRPDSEWNNPEPEIVLVLSPAGKIVGATLGNDVNLRDIEGRSALLLGRAKDNNASCALGPFIRLFDATFSVDDVRNAVVGLIVTGQDNFRMEGSSSMAEISRDVDDLAAATLSADHQYPDGAFLMCGTMFAPTDLRDGEGFTHKLGDIVEIATPKLGRLANRVMTTHAAPAWDFGVRALMRSLAARGLG